METCTHGLSKSMLDPSVEEGYGGGADNPVGPVVVFIGRCYAG